MTITNDDEVMREFLLESAENLNRLDQDLVALEQTPNDRERLGAIFRCVHTIKGTAGFLGLPKLEALTHAGENLLSRLRDGELSLDAPTTSALLGMVDAIRRTLTVLETSPTEPDDDHVAERAAIAAANTGSGAPSQVAAPKPTGLKLFTEVPKADPALSAPPVVVVPPVAPVAVVPAAAAPPPPPAPTPAATKAPAAHEEGDGANTRTSVQDTTIRVDVGLIDRVMNLVGELVLARNQILQFGTTLKDGAFANASQRLNLLTTELQEGVMKTRMQPIGTVWNKFPRIVRDLSMACGKHVALELDGTDTELDRTIIEAIKDPLTHAVRNAVDHGIESPEKRRAAGKPEAGRLLLRAFHEGGQVNIEISDDGAGLNLERIRSRAVERGLVSADRAARMSDREAAHLIFHAGFSTAEKVTNVSGRGVGMDVVKTNIEKIGGTVDLSSVFGRGTTLKIKIPLTLAIIPALIVTSGAERFAIPQVSLLELVRLEGEQAKRGIEKIHETTIYRLRGQLLPLVFLNDALRLKAAPSSSDAVNIVILQADDRQFGLVVDGISDTEEIVVKPLGKELKGVSGFAGATIMGDGRVALILDVLGIAQRANVVSASRDRALVEKSSSSSKDADVDRQALLLFRVGEQSRMAIPLSMVARLEEIPRASIERTGGRDVVQYRGAILPLIDLAREIHVDDPKAHAEDEPLQVIVFSDQGRSIGFVVDQIVDVVEDVVDVRHRVERSGILGAAVVHGKVTDLLDVHGVIKRVDPTFFAAPPSEANKNGKKNGAGMAMGAFGS
ncbi:MAG: chemotaxis protein CheW [Deltaproteobacteria bacterium]|nr:chemotaxis protein CheW [Deltaproteobacteria bacterium]